MVCWQGKGTLRRPGHRWDDTIKMDLREIVWQGMDWIDLILGRDKQWAFVNTMMSVRVKLNTVIFTS